MKPSFIFMLLATSALAIPLPLHGNGKARVDDVTERSAGSVGSAIIPKFKKISRDILPSISFLGLDHLAES
ncbi:MAG: hypothetical protein M1834_001284 [Cirrosporium novae-zelandiae]|nr:MAG: hypothetical protein M1834_001284 [Cirrosporium novae-zelandiae]